MPSSTSTSKSVAGELSIIKGVPRPPVLKVGACGANATAEIKRSEFSMGKNVPYVSDAVTLTLPIEAVKQQPAAE